MKQKRTTTWSLRLKQMALRHIKLALVPHDANQFRPHAVRRHGLVVFLLLVVIMQVGYSFTTSDTVLGAAKLTSGQLLKETNAERERHGLRPLSLDGKLSKAAALKAHDMFARQYWAHTAPDGTTPWHWMEKTGYKYAIAGENLARGFRSADAAMTAWMSSRDHRKNVLGEKYTDVGFAVAEGTFEGRPTTLVVALYGQPTTLSSAMSVTMPVALPPHQPLPLQARLGVALRSMTPVAGAAAGISMILIAVALGAHAYRRKLPKHLRESWYRHHGLLKAGGMISLVVVLIVLYSGGQI